MGQSSGGGGGGGGALGSGLSLAAAGLQAYGAYESGAATKAGDEYKAAELQRAAEYGELKAKQTAGQLTRNLTITLGNIDAIRAAAHTDPASPTGAAVRDYTEAVGTERRQIEVGNIEAQVRQNEADAAYMRFAGSQALLSGEITAGADILTGLAGAIPGSPGKTPTPSISDQAIY